MILLIELEGLVVCYEAMWFRALISMARCSTTCDALSPVGGGIRGGLLVKLMGVSPVATGARSWLADAHVWCLSDGIMWPLVLSRLVLFVEKMGITWVCFPVAMGFGRWPPPSVRMVLCFDPAFYWDQACPLYRPLFFSSRRYSSARDILMHVV